MVWTLSGGPNQTSLGTNVGLNALGSRRYVSGLPEGKAAASWSSFGKEDVFQPCSLFTRAKDSRLRSHVLKAGRGNIRSRTCVPAARGMVSWVLLAGSGQSKVQEHVGGFAERDEAVSESWFLAIGLTWVEILLCLHFESF